MVFFMDNNLSVLWQGHVEKSTNSFAGSSPKPQDIYVVQADGEELNLCYKILGRSPSGDYIHTFVGDQARELWLNWN